MVTPHAAFWNGKRVLLTGHTGFKGGWAAAWLGKLGAKVAGYSLAPSDEPSLFVMSGAPGCEKSEIGDVRDGDRIQAAMRDWAPDIVLHLAAQAIVQTSFVDPADTFDTNVMGLIRVLEAARRTPTVRVVLNVTSDKCYENREQIWAYRETDPMGGADPYSASKGCAELVTASWRRSFFAKDDGPVLVSARAGNVVGGGDWAADRLVPDCVRAFAHRQQVLIRNPRAVRPWQHVLEPISGYLTLVERAWTDRQAVAEGWNFGPGDQDTQDVEYVVSRLAALWGESAAWRQDERFFPKESLLLRVDSAKARTRLRWRPRLNIDETLRWTIDWYKRAHNGEPAAKLMLEQIAQYEKLGETI